MGQASFLVTCCRCCCPLAILMVPLADLVLAVVRRTAPADPRSRPTSSTCTTACLEIGHSHRARC